MLREGSDECRVSGRAKYHSITTTIEIMPIVKGEMKIDEHLTSPSDVCCQPYVSRKSEVKPGVDTPHLIFKLLVMLEVPAAEL
jgi:hypothetical protein